MALRVDNISKWFSTSGRRDPLFEGLTVDFSLGEICVVLGASGWDDVPISTAVRASRS